MRGSEAFELIDYGGRGDVPSDSGVVERRPWQAYRPADTLGASALITACSLGLDRADDQAASVCFAVGGSALRAAAWLRARGAAVGHAVSRSRLHDPDGPSYELAARTRISRQSDKRALTLAAIGSQQIADWLRPDRVAIVLVGGWNRMASREAHALVVVGAAMGALVLFDPAGDGNFEEIAFGEADQLRSHRSAAWEVLLAARPR